MKTFLYILITILFITNDVTSQIVVSEKGDTLICFTTSQIKQINVIVTEHKYQSSQIVKLNERVSNLELQYSICESAKSDLAKIQYNNDSIIATLKTKHSLDLQKEQIQSNLYKKQRNNLFIVSVVTTTITILTLLK